MLGLAREERLWYEQREVCVLRTRLLEHLVKLVLHLLPDSVAVRLDYHAAAHGRLLGQVGLGHQVVVPLAVVVSPFGQVFQFFCHDKCFVLTNLDAKVHN